MATVNVESDLRIILWIPAVRAFLSGFGAVILGSVLAHNGASDLKVGLLGAAILTTAIYILEDFGNPQLIGGSFYVLPTEAYSLISSFGEYTSASAVSTILLLLALGLYLAKVRLDGGRSFVTISGRDSVPSVARAV